MEAQSESVYTMHACFCMFGTNMHARSVLSNKIFALKLSRKLIKSALLVGWGLKVPTSSRSSKKSMRCWLGQL